MECDHAGARAVASSPCFPFCAAGRVSRSAGSPAFRRPAAGFLLRSQSFFPQAIFACFGYRASSPFGVGLFLSRSSDGGRTWTRGGSAEPLTLVSAFTGNGVAKGSTGQFPDHDSIAVAPTAPSMSPGRSSTAQARTRRSMSLPRLTGAGPSALRKRSPVGRCATTRTRASPSIHGGWSATTLFDVSDLGSIDRGRTWTLQRVTQSGL